MMENESFDLVFEGRDFTEADLRNHAFEQCTFVSCNFSKTVFSEALFENCFFKDCNLANISLIDCKWQEVTFDHCKISGLDLETLSKMLLSFSFENCALSYCHFKDLKVPGTKFLHCQLKECDFINANLSNADFSGSDLIGSSFVRCDLQKAKFSAAVNYRFDPNENKISGAHFSVPEVLNFLEPFDIVIE